MSPTRPALRYYGGKWKIAPWIISHFPPHRIYVEPFGGGASVLIRKPRSYGEVYNDLDKRVVNVFRVLQDPEKARVLEKKLRVTPFSREEFEISYRQSDDPVERARRTVIASFMGFGSDSVTRGCRTGFRSNANRSGTTPAIDWSRWPNHIQGFTERLRGVILENRDAREVMLSQDGPDTLHYVDPPYVHSTRSSGQRGYQFELTNSEHESLLEFLTRLTGMVVLSAYPHAIYDRLLPWGWVQLESGSLVFGNKPRTEVLWLNPACDRAQAQQSLPMEARA